MAHVIYQGSQDEIILSPRLTTIVLIKEDTEICRQEHQMKKKAKTGVMCLL
jgi:hypothetical protein